MSLGDTPWNPPAGAVQLRHALQDALDVPAVIDLILYGSQARHSTTGYSDVDAILVITDEVARDAAALRRLRPRIRRAQRHVLEYQPMQHHAFDVATPSLLSHPDALELPGEAVVETTGLFGRGVSAAFAPCSERESRLRLGRLTGQLEHVPAWPRHPWDLHRLLSMFELVPALFLQATGERVEKWRSFDIARRRFPEAWRPYETLHTVRERWPNRRYTTLRALLGLGGNPWVSVALWRRTPVTADAEIRALLTPGTLLELQALVGAMRAEVDA